MQGDRGRRLTLKDIAARAGVSEAAASFALNDKPGVSERTRARVRAVADELDWQPSHAARVLASSRSNTVGMVISRSAQSFGTESFFLRLITGLQEVLSRRRYAMLLQVIGSVDEEIATYRRWASESRVDAVVLVDLRVDDPRPAALVEIGLPAIVAGGPDPTGLLPSVFVDDAAAMRAVMEHLRAQDHRAVVYVCGATELQHIAARVGSFRKYLTEYGFDEGHEVTTDFSASMAAAATEAALTARQRPTAMIYDNEVMALAGLGVISRLGLRVPQDVAVVSWEDGAVCSAFEPGLTALTRDAFAFGADVAERMLQLIDSGDLGDYAEHVPSLVVRASTQR